MGIASLCTWQFNLEKGYEKTGSAWRLVDGRNLCRSVTNFLSQSRILDFCPRSQRKRFGIVESVKGISEASKNAA